nr:MAG TPA: hypothetical protein [Caudoviricetes sp.]
MFSGEKRIAFLLIVRECSLTFGLNYNKRKNKMQHFF